MHYSPGRSNKHNHGDGPDEMPELLTPPEAAQYLRTTTNTLAQDRYLGRGVPFIKAGKRVLYARADVLAYLAAGRNDPSEVSA